MTPGRDLSITSSAKLDENTKTMLRQIAERVVSTIDLTKPRPEEQDAIKEQVVDALVVMAHTGERDPDKLENYAAFKALEFLSSQR